LPVEAVLYPQPETDDVIATGKALRELGVDITTIDNPYAMPLALARRLAANVRQKPYLLWPGASTALGTLGYVSAGVEMVDAFAAANEPEPDVVVVAFGSGGTAVGLALGLAVGGWAHARVLAVRVADRTVANSAVARALEVSTSGLLAMGGWRPRAARVDITSSWFGAGYGHPTTAGREAARIAASLDLALEPTYTEKAFAAALAEYRRGRRVVFVQTFAGSHTA
jgi:D-cysteine desulfhydrase